MTLHWLRPLLQIDPSLTTEEFINEVYFYFKQVYESKKEFYNEPVYFKILGQLSQYNSSFRHFLTHDSNTILRDNSIDIQRSLRIHWIEDILLNHYDERILIYEKEVNGELRTHIFLDEDRYMLVLAYNYTRNRFEIRTAFYIENDRRLNDYLLDYRRYITQK